MAIYCTSDWHGQLDLAKQIMNYLRPDDKLYFLGDAGDRGNHGYEIMQMLLNDPRVTYLKGNHEDMLVDSLSWAYSERGRENCYLWFSNGGKSTWESIHSLSEEEQRKLVCRLRDLPERIDITNARGQNIILTHAGLDPDMSEKKYLSFGIKKPYLWNRRHDKYTWHGDENTYVLHGHTPVPLLFDEDYVDKETTVETCFYCENHKIDIDLGSFFTGTAALFNIDTFESIYFEAPVEGVFANER